MATWGEIRLELEQFAAAAGVKTSLSLLNGWIREVYKDELLDAHEWKGLEADAVLQTVAPYETGTVTVTLGSTAVTGAGTTFTSAMTGRRFRVSGRSEFYTFTYVSATSGTLDRNYEGDDASGAAYRIFQHIYTLPTAVKYVMKLRNERVETPLERKTVADMDRLAPARTTYGEPSLYAPHSDSDEATPPVVHAIELYPIPLYAAGYPYTYQKLAVEFTGANTTASPMPWVNTGAIKAGVRARILAHGKDYAGADRERAVLADLVERMVLVEERRTGPRKLAMPDRFVRHRRERWNQ